MENQYSISYFLDTRRMKKNGKYPLKLRVFTSLSKQQKLFQTKYEFTKNEFGSIWETMKPRNEHKDIRRDLQGILTKAEEEASKLHPFDLEKFEKKMGAKAGASNDLIWYLADTIDTLRANNQYGTASSYKSTIKALLLFVNHQRSKQQEDISFHEVTPKWLERFERYMAEERNVSSATIGIYLRNVRTVFNAAIDRKDILPEIYPFGKKMYVIPNSRKVLKALSKEDLRILYTAHPATKEQAKAKDFWFFSYSCNGMNIRDIAELKIGTISDDQIQYVRNKTKRTKKDNLKPITAHLTEYSKTIIEKYGDKQGKYLFPIFDQFDSEESKLSKCKIFTRFVNQHIKKLATQNGITKEISSYWARHSFATNAIQRGAPMEFVSEALNHKDMNTTKGYFAGFTSESKKEFADKLMDFG